MTQINSMFRVFFAAVMLAAFALPASAAQPPAKQYSLDITPTNASPGSGNAVVLPLGGGTVYWTIKNETPTGGNSAIGSFIIKKPPGATISNPAGASFDLATLAATGDLKVNGIPSLLPKDQQGTHSVTISFVLTPVSPSECQTIVWMPSSPQLVSVHTGNFSNTTFAYIPVSGLNQTTTFTSGTCHTVTGVANPSIGGTVSCQSPVFHGSNSVCTATTNTNYFLTGFSGAPINCVQIGTTNQCTVSNVMQNTTTTAYFSQSDGKVGCISGKVPNTGTVNNYDSSLGNTNFTYDPDTSNVPFGEGWGLRRGNNKDDEACVLVDYAFTPAVSGNGFVASLLFDQTSGQKATWKYLIVWPLIDVDSSNPDKGWTTFRPSVSWGIANPTSGTTDFVPGLFCNGKVAQVDITTLNGAQLAALLPVIPDDSAINGPFYTSPHAQFKPGQTAKVCIIRNGVTTDAPDGLVQQLVPFTEVLDEADAYITPSQ